MKRRGFLALALLPCLLLTAALCLPPQYSRTYLAALTDKAALLRSAPSPRIVLIGGSGTAFDVDSGQLEALLPGYTAVNDGLYAGLGTAVMLELALPSLREGDVVVFSPEMSSQTLSDWFDAQAMCQAAETMPSLLLRLNPSRWPAVAAALPRFAARKARFFLEGNAPGGEGLYARAAFNEKGDMRREGREGNVMPGGLDVNQPLSFDLSLPTEAFLGVTNRFVSACRERNIRVFFRLCPMNAAAMPEEERAGADAFEVRLAQALDCPLLGRVSQALMEPGWFYDTNFHLNSAGMTVYTVQLARELGEALGVETAPLPPLPDMPALIAAQGTQGNNEDEDCFLYTWTGGGWAASGLTDDGKARGALTLPSSHEGQAVVTFTADCLEGAANLTELTLQQGCRVIPDGAFARCPALRRVNLEQEDTGECTVGSGLLEGTGALVYVPAASYGSYCSNYFWARYAARLRPDEHSAAAAEHSDEPSSEPSAAPVTDPASGAPHSVTRLTYHGNGGTLRTGDGDTLSREITYAHLRVNTLQGTVWFEREGWLLTGWNTRADGTGTPVGLGSRMDTSLGGELYAQWLPFAPEADFEWRVEEGSASVASYLGQAEVCAVPDTFRGLPVRGILPGAFEGKAFSLLALPPSLRRVEDGAFLRCEIGELLLYDSLLTVSDACFDRCAGPESLRINAATAPAYSGTWFDTYPDKYDRLLSLQGQRKLVLASGSSGRYGYDSAMLAQAFPYLQPVNMGVYAFTNTLPQLKLLLPLVQPGDMLLYAPEFDAVQEQFCVTNRMDASFWPMMEGCYDMALALPLRDFTGVFDSLGEYLSTRSRMPRGSYEVSPANYDDDGNYYPFSTYNRYGDFILPRPNSEGEGRLRHNIADYTAASFPREVTDSLNAALRPFSEKGLTVCFSYTPRNSASLTEASTPENRRELEALLEREIEVPVISRLEDYLMPRRYFYLIDSHPSTEGAQIRTRMIIRDLRAFLEVQQDEEN